MRINSQFFVSFILVFKGVDAGDRGTKKKNGRLCIFDSNCISDLCGGIVGKKCVECKGHSDCGGDGYSPKGAAPAVFCTKEKKCSQWIRGEPLDKKGYALNIDTVTWIPREVINKATGFEIIRFVTSNTPNTGIKVNDTHAFVPMNVHLQGEYALENHVTTVEESGIVNLFVGKNPASVVLDDPYFGLGLKYHALSVSGNTNTRSAERVAATVKKRTKFTNNLAKQVRYQRDKLVSTAIEVTNAGAKLVESSQDVTHMNQIREFVKYDNGKSGVAEHLASSQYSNLVKKAKKAKVDSATVDSQKSMNHCRHWEDKKVFLTKTHAVIPLETNFFACAGQVEMSPSRWFGIASGNTFFHYNKDDKALEMYQIWTEQMHVNMDNDVDQTGFVPNKLWVGPADGKAMKVSEVDGRTDEYHDPRPIPKIVLAALDYMNSLKSDYKRLYAKPGKMCSSKRRQIFQASFEKAKLEMAKPKFVEKMWQEGHIIQSTTDAIDCGVVYMRTPTKNGNAFDFLEYAIWLHLILETDIENTIRLALGSAWWDDGVNIPYVKNDGYEEDYYGASSIEDEVHEEVGDVRAEGHEEAGEEE